jgi:hypothetical protein
MRQHLILPHDLQPLNSKTLNLLFIRFWRFFSMKILHFTAANYFFAPKYPPSFPDSNSKDLTNRRFSIGAASHLPPFHMPSLILHNWPL